MENADKKEYIEPVITRVVLEDKPVVALNACKDSPNAPGCGIDGVAIREITPS